MRIFQVLLRKYIISSLLQLFLVVHFSREPFQNIFWRRKLKEMMLQNRTTGGLSRLVVFKMMRYKFQKIPNYLKNHVEHFLKFSLNLNAKKLRDSALNLIKFYSWDLENACLKKNACSKFRLRYIRKLCEAI